MKRGQLGSSGAGLTGEEYRLTPFYTQLAPFALLPIYSYLFPLVPSSCAHSLNARYNSTISSSLSNSQATQVCIFISCEVTVCLEPISYFDITDFFLTVVFVNSWLVGQLVRFYFHVCFLPFPLPILHKKINILTHQIFISISVNNLLCSYCNLPNHVSVRFVFFV